jgi:VIT1/CCC1 family predicted Fe2+/Mn2+ transporter
VHFFGGSLPPILPNFFMHSHSAIWVAILFSVIFLFLAGVAKTRLTKVRPLRSGLETTLLGVFASGVGYDLGWLAETFI